jgi:hypothetical protein
MKVEYGYGYTVFSTEDRAEWEAMKVWCRATIGKSHGPGTQWWPARETVLLHFRYRVMISAPQHLTMAKLVWMT